MSDNKSRDIFYGVVAVATLIVALVGATLAYFSISASSNEGAVNAQAATVSIEYNDGQQVSAQADKLIPATLDVVKKAYEANDFSQGGDTSANQCTDSNNQQVCSIYRFTVRSDIERTISATLNSEHNGFTYLSYAVRDVTTGEWLKLNGNDEFVALASCDNTDKDEETEELIPDNDCYTISGGVKTYSTSLPNAVNSIFGYTTVDEQLQKQTRKVATTTQVYDLVIFLDENNKNQNIDQGKKYNGTIIVDVMDGGLSGQITGYIKDENQSEG